MMHRIEQADALEFLRSLPGSSVGLILTDPPYFKVKPHGWDRQWSKRTGFLDWLDCIAVEWARVLKPNGTLACFAGGNPTAGATTAARVEVLLGERFNVVASAVWVKADAHGYGKFSGTCRAAQRAHFPQTERVIICERQHQGGTLYAARMAHGWSVAEAARRFGCDSRLVTLWEEGRRDPWAFRAAIRSEYGVSLTRRPFDAEAGAHHTDVWTYPTVPGRKGKHPCEKPEAMALDLVRQCSRDGDVVLDTFAGSGAFLVAAARLGRIAWGCDFQEKWARQVAQAVAGASPEPVDMGEQFAPRVNAPQQMPLFTQGLTPAT